MYLRSAILRSDVPAAWGQPAGAAPLKQRPLSPRPEQLECFERVKEDLAVKEQHIQIKDRLKILDNLSSLIHGKTDTAMIPLEETSKIKWNEIFD